MPKTEALEAALESFNAPIDLITIEILKIEDQALQRKLDAKVKEIMGLLVDIEYSCGSWKPANIG